jgi:hypothetical protein
MENGDSSHKVISANGARFRACLWNEVWHVVVAHSAASELKPTCLDQPSDIPRRTGIESLDLWPNTVLFSS